MLAFPALFPRAFENLNSQFYGHRLVGERANINAIILYLSSSTSPVKAEAAATEALTVASIFALVLFNCQLPLA